MPMLVVPLDFSIFVRKMLIVWLSSTLAQPYVFTISIFVSVSSSKPVSSIST